MSDLVDWLELCSCGNIIGDTLLHWLDICCFLHKEFVTDLCFCTLKGKWRGNVSFFTDQIIRGNNFFLHSPSTYMQRQSLDKQHHLWLKLKLKLSNLFFGGFITSVSMAAGSACGSYLLSSTSLSPVLIILTSSCQKNIK
jgi:hypothetical protein